MAPPSLGMYKSALVYLSKKHREGSMMMDQDISKSLDRLINGHTRGIKDKQLKGVMSSTERKSPISFNGYCLSFSNTECNRCHILIPRSKDSS